MAENRATSVQPYFGRGSPPTAATNSCASGASSPGPRPWRHVDDVDVEAGEHVAHVTLAASSPCGSERSGS